MKRALFPCLATLLLATRVARAEPAETAPELERLELRQKFQAEFRRLFQGLDAADQKRLVGAYVAFDDDPGDPSAMVACDDDGDFVVVVTDAMLLLASNVARAQSFDDANGSRRIEDYASFVARTQLPGKRLLPPPPGFFTAQKPATTFDTRLREAFAFVAARELVHLRAGDLVCRHPTATHESGDDVWTPDERRRANEGAANVYPGRQASRDAEATVRVLEAGKTERGALGLLRFFAQVELERLTYAGRFVTTYLALHPSATLRAASVTTAAESAKQSRSP